MVYICALDSKSLICSTKDGTHILQGFYLCDVVSIRSFVTIVVYCEKMGFKLWHSACRANIPFEHEKRSRFCGAAVGFIS